MSNTDNDGRCRGCGAFFAHAEDCPGETPPALALYLRVKAFAEDCVANGDMTPAAERMLLRIITDWGKPEQQSPPPLLPDAKMETTFDALSRLVETLSTREGEASTIAASAAELSGTPAPYWRGLAEGYRRCHLAVSQIITDAQTGGTS